MGMYECIFKSTLVICSTVVLCMFFRTWGIAIKAQYWRDKNVQSRKES